MALHVMILHFIEPDIILCTLLSDIILCNLYFLCVKVKCNEDCISIFKVLNNFFAVFLSCQEYINKPKMAYSCDAFTRDYRERLARDKQETTNRDYSTERWSFGG